MLQAFYVDAIGLDDFKDEQQRIRAEEQRLKSQLHAIDADFDAIKTNLDRALEISRGAASAHRLASPGQRRKWNQLLFEGLYIDDDTSSARS